MNVPLYRPTVREKAIAAASEAMRSGWLGMGPRTAAFEKAFAAYLGVDHAVAVNTCTSALHIAVRLLDLQPGRQVITTALTFVATNQVIQWEGLNPVFADIDPRTGNIAAASIRDRITPATAAVMVVHFAGYPCDMDEINGIAADRNLAVIEDCAHACGAVYRGRKVGTGGNLCAYSFGPPKNLTACEGGMLIVRNDECDRRARQLRYMGISRDTHGRVAAAGSAGRHWEYEVKVPGMRYHMSDINAAIAIEHLPHLDEDNARRAAIAWRYRELLAGVAGVTCIEHAPDRTSSHHLFCILAEERDRLADALLARGVTVGMHYQRNDAHPIFRKQDLPGTEYFCQRVLSLPMFPQLSDEQVEYVVAAIRQGW